LSKGGADRFALMLRPALLPGELPPECQVLPGAAAVAGAVTVAAGPTYFSSRLTLASV